MRLLIDETGDCKKGKHTDYVKRQCEFAAILILKNGVFETLT
jgi:SRSO17 transposase